MTSSIHLYLVESSPHSQGFPFEALLWPPLDIAYRTIDPGANLKTSYLADAIDQYILRPGSASPDLRLCSLSPEDQLKLTGYT